MAYTYMVYPVQNIVFLKHRIEDIFKGKGEEKRTAMKVLAAHLGYTGAIGGVAGLPFAWFLGMLWDLFNDPEDDPEKLLGKVAQNDSMRRTIARGIPAVFGNDSAIRLKTQL